MKNFYKILGVTPDSTDAEIKSAYRKLARKFHPDVNPQGADVFKDVSEAYATLSNPHKRLQYDTINGFFKTNKKTEQKTADLKVDFEYKKTQSNNNEQKTTYSKTDFRYKKTQSSNNTGKKQNINKDTKEEFSKKINEIFEEFGKKSKPIPKRGTDIYEEITLSIQEAINGCEKVVNVIHSSQCPHCKGRKFINGAKCPKCNGTGEKNEYRKINVKIPKNIKNNTKLRIKQEGNSGENGGQNGDLYLKIKIETKAKVDNEIYDIPITPYEAVLGGNIFVAGVNLKLPPKTRSGQKFRIAEQGEKNNDIIVKVYIEIPSDLSDDEIRLYEKLKKISSQNIRENIWLK